MNPICFAENQVIPNNNVCGHRFTLKLFNEKWRILLRDLIWKLV